MLHVVLCTSQYSVVITDVSKEHIPSICGEWEGGAFSFLEKFSVTALFQPPKTKMLLPIFQFAVIVLWCSLVLYNVITPRFRIMQ
jgi:hypothetical protein